MSEDIILQVGVKALLKSPEGKFLFVRRSPKKYPEVGPKWDIVGGRIDPGSTLMDNLKREVMEEVKLKLEREPKLVAAQDILRVPGRHVVRLTFTGEISGSPELDSDHMEYKWFTLFELKALSESELDLYFKELLDKGLFDI
ncbi:MAG: NUDIX domain-containing protein [Patescibacteria group bacterium]|nr:NUDIX domain-containing protein [Patescibacteria group bacterium]